MINNEKNALYLVNKKIPVLSQLLLLFSYSISKNPLFISLFIFPKFIPMLIITSDFTLNTSIEYKNNLILSNFLRKLTLFSFFNNISETYYFIIGLILFIFELPFIINILWYIYIIKKNNGKRKKIVLSLYSKIMFYINSLTYQLILEFLSFSLLIVVRKKLILPEEGLYEKYKNYKLVRDNENLSLIILIIFHSLCCLSFIFIIFYGFFCHIIINCVYKSNKENLNIRHTRNFFIFIWFNVISCSHYYEIFLNQKQRITFKIFINFLILISLFFEFISNIITYEKNNIFSFLIKFILLFLFQSLVLNTFIGISKFQLTKIESISLLIINLIISFILYFFLMYLRNERFLRLSGNYLFVSLEQNKMEKVLESYNYILDELIKIKHNKQKAGKLIDIYYYHKKKCLNDDCKCKIIDSFPRWNIDLNEEYIKKFVLSIGFFMEEILTSKELVKNFQHLIFLIDYFNFVKDNLMLSYLLLLTVINKHSKNLSVLEWYELYNLILVFKKSFDKKFIETYHIRVFKSIFEDITERLEFNKNLCKYSKYFIELIETKIAFENSLKIQFDSDEDIRKVQSNLNKREFIIPILQKLSKLNQLNKKIQFNLLKTSKTRKNTEFYYISFLFYNIFSDKIPEEILTSFNYLSSSGESFKSMSIFELSKKFNELIEKSFKKNNNLHHMIIKFENGFKIRYINSFLCSRLQYNKDQLIGEDFGNLFPVSIRESHNKAILRTITIYQNLFMRKNAFLFDSKKHSISCSIVAASMPHFDKTLVIISEIELTDNDACYFILDKDFNSISISHSIEKQFYFNLDILKKTDMELIDIFNLNPHLIKKSLEKTLELIRKIKKEIKENNIEFFNKKLYSTNTNNLNSQKFIIKPYSMKISNLNGFSFDLSLLHDKLQREYYKTEVSKTLIIQTVIRTLKKLSDKFYKDINIEELINKAVKLYRNLISSGKSKKYVRRGSFISVNMIDELKDSIFLSLRCHIKLIYNSPIYIFKFKDLKQLTKTKGIEKVVFNDIPKKCFSNTKREKKILLNSKLLFQTSSKKDLIKIGSLNSNPNNSSEINQDSLLIQSLIKTDNENIDSIEEDQFNNNQIILSETYYNNQFGQNEVEKRFHCLKYSGIIIQFICFLLTIIIIVFKQNRLKRIHIYGNCYKELAYFRDKISYLYSSLLTQCLQFGEYTQMSISDEDMYEYLQLSSNKIQYSLKAVYDSIIHFDIITHKDLFQSIFNNFSKTSGTWELIEEKSDIITELNYMVYLINKSIKNFNPSLIKRDLDFFLSGAYRGNLKSKQNSLYVRVLFYFMNNYSKCFIYVIVRIAGQISGFFNEYIKNSEKFIFFSLLCWGVLEIFFFIISQFMNQIFNKYILNLILSIFIHEKLEKNYVKNKPENIYMKHKIQLYINLIQNFSKENKNLFLHHKNDFKRKFQKYKYSAQHFYTNTKLLFNINFENNKNNNDLSNNYEPLNEKSTISLNASGLNNNNTSTANFLGLNTMNPTIGNSVIDNNKIKLKKKIHSKLKKNINEKEKTPEEKEKTITYEQIIPFLKRESIVISYPIQFIIFILFLLAIIICIFHIYISLKFDKRSKELFIVLNSFTYYFMNLPKTLLILKTVLILQIPIIEDLKNFKSDVTQGKNNLYDTISNPSFSKFKNTNYFWEQINLSLNNSKINLPYLCSNNDLCLLYLKRGNGYCSEGITLCYDLIIQSYLDIIKDYSSIRNAENFTRANKSDISNFLKEHNMDSLQENVEFIFSEIQNQFYTSFMNDFNYIKEYLAQQTININFIFLIFQIILAFFITLIMGLYMIRKINLCNEGVNLFYIGFYKDKLSLD